MANRQQGGCGVKLGQKAVRRPGLLRRTNSTGSVRHGGHIALLAAANTQQFCGIVE